MTGIGAGLRFFTAFRMIKSGTDLSVPLLIGFLFVRLNGLC